MTVAELIKELEKMPQDKEVVILLGYTYTEAQRVYEWDKELKSLRGIVFKDEAGKIRGKVVIE